MRFVQFLHHGVQKIGIELKSNPAASTYDAILDLSSKLKETTKEPWCGSMVDFLERHQGTDSTEAIELAKRAISDKDGAIHARNTVKILAPITRPDKVICIGMNYRDHCEEQNVPVPVEPVFFNKFPSTIIGTDDDIQYTTESQELDWEVELTVVIGVKGKSIKKEDAMRHVFGYTIGHDVTARDLQFQRNGGQWLLGKTLDHFCPLGPAIVTKDEILDPHNLGLRCRVNGVTKQDGNTKHLIHKIEQLIEYISRFVTLLPGDLLLTGTPAGIGYYRKPPEYLKKGDVVECEIDQIGCIVNKLV